MRKWPSIVEIEVLFKCRGINPNGYSQSSQTKQPIQKVNKWQQDSNREEQA